MRRWWFSLNVFTFWKIVNFHTLLKNCLESTDMAFKMSLNDRQILWKCFYILWFRKQTAYKNTLNNKEEKYHRKISAMAHCSILGNKNHQKRENISVKLSPLLSNWQRILVLTVTGTLNLKMTTIENYDQGLEEK